MGASIRKIMKLHAQRQRGDSSARPEGGGGEGLSLSSLQDKPTAAQKREA